MSYLGVITTGSFPVCGKMPQAISTAGYPPEGWTGRQYRKLAPKRWIYDAYMETGDSDAYTVAYKEHVLAKLDPIEVFKDIGEDAILCCRERSDEFCHRHLVRKWFEEAGFIALEHVS